MDLTTTKTHLPANVEALVFDRIVKREMLKAYMAKVRAADLTGVTGAKTSGREDAQDLADYLLDVDVRLGELLSQPRQKEGKTKEYGSLGGTIPNLPSGVSKALSHQAQTLSEHKDIVEQVKADAREAGVVVTTDKVYKMIKSGQNLSLRKSRIVSEAKKAMQIIPYIIANDCMVVIDQIAPIDLLLTDPPYFTDGNFTEQISSYLAKVKPTGQAYVFASSDPDEIIAYIGMNIHHMKLEQILVWNYNNTGQRQPNERYTSNYQLAFYYRGPDAPHINKPGDGKHQYACQTINAPDGRIGDRYHEWQKPIELMERLIRNSSSVGDLVFDPFAGSGSTLIAAAKLGRNAIGCDSDPAAIKICLERGCVEC
jgi:hypothetical protein